MKTLFLLTLVALPFSAYCQIIKDNTQSPTVHTVAASDEKVILPTISVKDSANKNKIVYHYVEQMPDAGYDLQHYLVKNIHYPATDKQGRVLVIFIVNAQGGIDSVKIMNSVCPALDTEAIRVVKNMPPWKPGKQHGEPVNVYFTLPVSFKHSR